MFAHTLVIIADLSVLSRLDSSKCEGIDIKEIDVA